MKVFVRLRAPFASKDAAHLSNIIGKIGGVWEERSLTDKQIETLAASKVLEVRVDDPRRKPGREVVRLIGRDVHRVGDLVKLQGRGGPDVA